jgi:hypothetical protein
MEKQLVRPTCRLSFGFHFSDLSGLHQQQQNPADEGKRSSDRRDKVAVSGFDVHAQEIDGLSGCRECDARVSEYHDAECDQKDRYNGFGTHIKPFPGVRK